jgi:hypothetical protein
MMVSTSSGESTTTGGCGSVMVTSLDVVISTVLTASAPHY